MIDRPRVSGNEFRNWGDTQRASLSGFVTPASEDEVAEAVATATRRGQTLKPVGAGHSWSDAACTDGVLMSLDNMRRLRHVDHRTGTVVADAGMRLHELNDALARQGRALPIVGSISAQSLAGATATGTHGTAPREANIASNILAFNIVLADGTVREVDAASDPSLFRAARVGLGALGVVTQVTMRTVPAFNLLETVEPVPFDEAVARIPDLVAEEEFVKVWWLPHAEKAVIFTYRRTDEPSTMSERQRMIDEKVVNRYLFPGLLSLAKVSNRIIPPVNRLVAGAYFRPATEIGRSDRVLNVAMPPKHDEMEYALPVERAADSFRFMRDTIVAEGMRIDFILELRFSAADDAWMSPAFDRDSCWIGAYTTHTEDRDRYLAACEEQSLDWEGRPHWGKQFAATGEQLRPRFKHWDDFADLRDRLDPTRTFDNAFLQRLFG